ncbi:MAG: rhomboid family intramembrane serine protease [Rhizobiaceae bacterium]|nr:rhomboid family intramembrane serine protease [Rhizobiaceae bacterium]MCV0407690.1 rhomboid family intramembrane serine protease [Rhizobiaceae bacterium]
MFIPLHDANDLKHISLQYVTIGLIAANVLVFVFTGLSSQDQVAAAAFGLGYIPALLNDSAELAPELVIVPEGWTYVTYSFLHGDIFHLGGNMLFLWVFGDNVEDALGHVRYLIFYVLCAAAGAFLHGLAAPDSQVPLIGASGAVAGIVAAYLILHPRVKVWVLVLMRLPLRIPAFIPLVLWILFQFAMFAIGGEDEISWAAHIGGITAGALLVLVMRRRGVPLFDRAIVTPDAVETVRPHAAVPVTGPPRWGRR